MRRTPIRCCSSSRPWTRPGKDGAIKHVMSGVNPQGCQVFSFKHPSAEELRARLPVAHHAQPAGARPHRHLQPLLLRGGADRARAPGDPARREAARRARTKNDLGASATAPSRAWSATCTATAPASSSSSCTCRRRSSASASSRASTSRTRTGSSAPPTSRSADSGRTT